MATTRCSSTAPRCCRRPLRASKVHSKTEATTNEPQQCVICLDTISSRGKLGVCDHAFCYVCIFEWSKNCNTCPLCKQRFRCITKVSLIPGGSPDRQVFVSDKDQREWYEEDFVDSEGFSTTDIFESLNEYDLDDSFIDDRDASWRYDDDREETQQRVSDTEYTSLQSSGSESSIYELRTRRVPASASSESSVYETRNRRERRALSSTSTDSSSVGTRRALLPSSTSSDSSVRTRRERQALSSSTDSSMGTRQPLSPSSTSSDSSVRTRRERQALSSSTDSSSVGTRRVLSSSTDSSSVGTRRVLSPLSSDSSAYNLRSRLGSTDQTTCSDSSGFNSFSSDVSLFADFETEEEFSLNYGSSRRKHKLLKFDSDTDDDDEEDFITIHHAATRRGMRQVTAVLLTSDSETELEQDYLTCSDKPATQECSTLIRRQLHIPNTRSFTQSSMPHYLTSRKRRRYYSPPGPSKPVLSDSDITQFTSDEEEDFNSQPVTSRGVATRSHTHQTSRYPQVSMTTSTAGVWLTTRGKRAEQRASQLVTRRGQKRKRRERVNIYQSRHDGDSSDDSDWDPFQI